MNDAALCGMIAMSRNRPLNPPVLSLLRFPRISQLALGSIATFGLGKSTNWAARIQITCSL